MNYRIETKSAFRIVGVRAAMPNSAQEGFEAVPVFWQQSAVQIPQLIALMEDEPKGLLGVSTCNEVENEQNYYYIAVASSAAVPHGMHELTIPAQTWAIFTGGGTSADIQTLQQRIVAEWLPTSGYEWANAPDVEVYLDDNSQNMRFEVWLPVVEKQN